jgi:hypothetical protein
MQRLFAVLALTTMLGLGYAVLGASEAQAQTPDPCATETCNRVGPDGKGIMGGLILGAEIGLMTNALIVYAGVRELDEWWAWILWPAVLGAGGAVAGYYGLEDPSFDGGVTRGSPEGAVALFAISMALIVPTFVGVLALTAYSPGADTEGSGATSEEDAEGTEEAETNSAEPAPAEPAAEPPPAEEAAPGEGAQSAMQRVLAGGPGLLRFDRGAVLLGVPMLYTSDSFTRQERAHAHLPQMVDVRIPVVSGVF